MKGGYQSTSSVVFVGKVSFVGKASSVCLFKCESEWLDGRRAAVSFVDGQ